MALYQSVVQTKTSCRLQCTLRSQSRSGCAAGALELVANAISFMGQGLLLAARCCFPDHTFDVNTEMNQANTGEKAK